MSLRKARTPENHQMRADKPPEPAHDAERLQRLYEDNLHVIYRFIYSKVGNREEAEDLTSQVFIKAVRSIDNSRDTASIQSWLFQVAPASMPALPVSAFALPALMMIAWTSLSGSRAAAESRDAHSGAPA